MVRSRIVWPIALDAVITLYIVVRFWDITASCLWFDEIFSVHAAEHGWDAILKFVSLDLIHPPLFYLLLKIWIAIGGESLIWLRMFPVLFSILAIAPFLLLCRELRLSQWAALLALLLFAVNGSLIKYSQEVRMYSMLLCLSLFSMWLFARYFRNGIGIVLLAAVNVFLVYTHYFGWLVVISEVLTVLVYQRAKLRKIFLMFLAVSASFLPWLIAVLVAAKSGSEFGQNIGWMQRPGPVEVGQLILNLIEPFYYSAMSIDPVSIYRISMPLLLLAIISLAVYFAKSRVSDEDQKTSSRLLVIFSVVPLLIAFIASWLLPYSIWGTRHLVIAFALLSILIANAFVRLPNFKVRTFVLTTVFLFIGYAFFTQIRRPQAEPIWCGFEPLGREIQAELNGPIVVFEDLAAYHFWFAFRNNHLQSQIVKAQDFPGMPEDTAYFLPRGFNEVPKVSADDLNYDQIWLVYRARVFDPFSPPLYTFFEKGYEVVEQKTYDYGYQKLIGVLLRRKR